MIAAGASLLISIAAGGVTWRALAPHLAAADTAWLVRAGLLAVVAAGIAAAVLLFWSALAMRRTRAAAASAALDAQSRERRNAARLDGIIRSAMEAIIVVDDAQRVVLFNPMAEKLFLCSAAEATGAALDRFIPERYRAGHKEDVERFGRTGVSERQMGKQRRLYALRANGTEFPIEASISQYQEGGRRLYTVMLRDITARVEAEDALRASREELRLLSGSIQAAREDEKTRIARELHDDLGQQLTALKMDVTILEDELQAGTERGPLLSHLKGMYELLDATVASVRRIAADLRPVMLDDLGLAPAVEWLVNDFTQRYRLRVDAELDVGPVPFRPEAATAIFRIVQEGLTNVARHANATQVWLEVLREGERFVVRIADDGRGMPAEAVPGRKSFGLLGVRERARMLDGRVTIDSVPGRGFRLQVDLPLAAVLVQPEPAGAAP
ncbi:hypothetical protein GCM10023144_46860 [Pigmentiphaga soli]|uniref:Histidine kinase n=2 Tax=Pigmentiphaga soli TaxID=1007095 RepID=A0ABP8HSG5_9BURK